MFDSDFDETDIQDIQETSDQDDIFDAEDLTMEEQFAADIESMSFNDLSAEQERLNELSQMDELDIFAAYDALQANQLNSDIDGQMDADNDELPPVSEDENGDGVYTLTRNLTEDILESRERDTEEVLDNYRDNLREYGVDERQIEEFISQEREKINAEYTSGEHGDDSASVYEMPTDWREVAESLMGQELQEEGINDAEPIADIDEKVPEIQEMDINYDEIYEGIHQEALEQGFEDIDIDADKERLEESLQNFTEENWESLSLEDQKRDMADLADYVVDVIGFKNPPKIEYYNNAQMGDFGGYDASTNTLNVNEYMLFNSEEAADTVAHELWHAHQHECAMNPQNARDYQYQYNFTNYIPPNLGQEAYESQLIEAEARAFAAQFKDRLSHIERRT